MTNVPQKWSIHEEIAELDELIKDTIWNLIKKEPLRTAGLESILYSRFQMLVIGLTAESVKMTT